MEDDKVTGYMMIVLRSPRLTTDQKAELIHLLQHSHTGPRQLEKIRKLVSLALDS